MTANTRADSDDRAHVFRSDGAQGSDLIVWEVSLAVPPGD